jgi:hypothetical protein
MTFIPYPKIYRLGTPETEGILDGLVTIHEKIDGANLSIWMEKGEIHVGSRNQEITEGFNGAYEYCLNDSGIRKLLSDHPNYRLYGEWLVRHTLQYKETAYRKFYLFDIFVDTERLDQINIMTIAAKYSINIAKFFGLFSRPSLDKINQFIGLSDLGDQGEGVVIKNRDFINQFGDNCYAKIVTESFRENNGLKFEANSKHSESYWETWVTHKYVTLSRVEKAMNKSQPMIDTPLDLQHTSRIVGMVTHDIVTEEAWEIFNRVPKLDFKVLKNILSKKIAFIYKEILSER